MKKIVDYLTFNFQHSTHASSKKIFFLITMLIVSVFIFLLFTLISIYISHNHKIAILDFSIALISTYILYHLYKYKNVPLAIKFSTLNLLLFFIAFIFINGSSHFSLIWTIFFPIFATLANGKKVGLEYSLLFYAFLYPVAYSAIGVWDNGNWLLVDWLRLVTSSLVLIAIMYFNEMAFEESSKKLEETMRKKAHYLEELKKISLTDDLTGLYNRRYFKERAQKFLESVQKEQKCFTFFIADIDYFKNYNDFYGHYLGDEALINIAQAIKSSIQDKENFVFRLGGEEFGGVLLSTTFETSEEKIKTMRKSIQNLQLEHKKSKVSKYLSVSIGVYTLSYQHAYEINDLYKYADAALYKAKEKGRNRIEFTYSTNAPVELTRSS